MRVHFANTYSALKVFLWVFSATILRPLTSARNYATIADPKKQIREVIFASIFRNNRARKRIRTLIFHQGSYAHRLAQRRGFEPPDESPPSHDFQSCSLNHSDISAKPCNHIIFPQKRQLILRAFRQKVFGNFLIPPMRGRRGKKREKHASKRVKSCKKAEEFDIRLCRGVLSCYTVREQYEPRFFVAARRVLRAFGKADRRAFFVCRSSSQNFTS